MMNLLSIMILIIGGLNWASIGFLQYDFIAGFFGTQASIFSRLIYISIGIATLYVVFMAFKYKGNIKIFDRKHKKEKEQNSQKEYIQHSSDFSPAPNAHTPAQTQQSYETHIASTQNYATQSSAVQQKQYQNSNNNDILS